MFKLQFVDKPWQIGGALCGLIILHLATKAIWRLYFHPLSKYPGPKLWAATSLVNTFYVLKTTRVYKVSELHNKYGPVVRVGPNEISYIDERAWKDIYSAHKSGGELQKFMPAADIKGGFGVFNNPDNAKHLQIRKFLSTGFSEKAVREKEGILQGYISLLMQRFEEKAKNGEKLDATWWLDCLGADIAGQFGYGESFHGLETSTLPEIITIGNNLLRGLSIGLAMGQYPVLRNIGDILRKMSPFEKIFKGIIDSKVGGLEKRVDAGQIDEVQDYYSIMTRNKDAVQQLGLANIKTISADLIIAGSDTTATALTVAIYLLLKSPSKLTILVEEIRSAFKSEEEITMVSTNSLKYQTAVISESMRMYPAGPETTRRIANKDGNVICGQFVPEGTLVGVYHWAAGRFKAAWKDADEFVPERWLGNDRYKDDVKGVLNVWNSGPRNCIGQNFALAYVKLVLARLIWRFDMKLCKESENLMDDVGVSVLLYHKGPLMIRLNSVRD
ncbi:hypothetical protein VTL71DRAFT_4620 [Oculimacula yallundae]|uniref:Cytochrome P450 n=1 Tax=Oculimacula yallundae TaxID=86028 RepID=A0ABR4C440_9HELO